MKTHFLPALFFASFFLISKSNAQIDFGTVQLYNALTDQSILNISDGTTYYLDTVGDSLNVVAVPPMGVTVESVRFLTSVNENRTESTPPYAFEGDNNGDFFSWLTLPNHIGTPISFTVEYWSGNSGTGTLLGDDTFTITFRTTTPPGGNSPWTASGQDIYFDAGGVAIGSATVPNGYALGVDGHVRAREIRVDQDTWPDYVFAEDYNLPTLQEIRRHIDEKGHLPHIPSAVEVEAYGIELGEMNKLLLEKIEEQMLYILQLEERIKQLEKTRKN